MKLTQIKGNTWVLEGAELIPLYITDGSHCVLLDTGLQHEQDDIEQTLLSAGLTPSGILCSHAHVDHCANNGYFQKKYNIPVALTAQEAGMCSSELFLTYYMYAMPPSYIRRRYTNMIHTPDVLVPPVDCRMEFAGAEFTVIQTPGHSPGHICVVTPDNVCYVADALLSRECLGAKLPYHLGHRMAMESHDKLLGLGCDFYVMAHLGICTGAELPALVEDNRALTRRRCGEILALIQKPMGLDEICVAACRHFSLVSDIPVRSMHYQRNVRWLVDYLVDEGKLEIVCVDGIAHYRPTQG